MKRKSSAARPSKTLLRPAIERWDGSFRFAGSFLERQVIVVRKDTETGIIEGHRSHSESLAANASRVRVSKTADQQTFGMLIQTVVVADAATLDADILDGVRVPLRRGPAHPAVASLASGVLAAKQSEHVHVFSSSLNVCQVLSEKNNKM